MNVEARPKRTLADDIKDIERGVMDTARMLGYGALVGQVVLGGRLIYTFQSGDQIARSLPAGAEMDQRRHPVIRAPG